MRPCFDIIIVEISTIAPVKSLSGLFDKELTFWGLNSIQKQEYMSEILANNALLLVLYTLHPM